MSAATFLRELLKVVAVVAILLSFFLSGLLFDLERKIEAGPSEPTGTLVHAMAFGPYSYFVDAATFEEYRSNSDARNLAIVVGLLTAGAALMMQWRRGRER